MKEFADTQLDNNCISNITDEKVLAKVITGISDVRLLCIPKQNLVATFVIIVLLFTNFYSFHFISVLIKIFIKIKIVNAMTKGRFELERSQVDK